MSVRAELDHLVVVAPTVAAGRAWVEGRLGVPLQAGGRHVRMGTHNALLGLGPSAYLEVIAVDPDLPDPGRPRWFALDQVRAGDAPRLGLWVARTTDLEGAVAAAPVPLGEILPMTRDDLRWRITVPADGSVRFGGALPPMIQWDAGVHPALRMEDRGCRLIELSATVPKTRPSLDEEPIGIALDRLGLLGAIALIPGPVGILPRLSALIATPHGEVELG
ncbi:MAG: VOC family protein [Chloroflexota bacterium]